MPQIQITKKIKNKRGASMTDSQRYFVVKFTDTDILYTLSIYA